jgi:hypothetical protein
LFRGSLVFEFTGTGLHYAVLDDMPGFGSGAWLFLFQRGLGPSYAQPREFHTKRR